MKFAAAVMAAIVAVSGMAPAAEAWGCDLGLGTEYPDSAKEAEAVDAITKVIGAKQEDEWNNGQGQAYRFFHAKTHGCVRAKFKIAEDIPSELAQGVFSRPGREYDSVTRFSNGLTDINPDSTPDTRGFAIQILDVDGQRLLSEDHTNVQTFIAAAYPSFLFHSAEQIGGQITTFARTGPLGAAAKAVWLAANPKTAIAVAKTLLAGKDLLNPFAGTYWSQTPYRWGSGHLAVKYKFEPCVGQAVPNIGKAGRDYLRNTIDLTLNDDDIEVCYNMFVQKQEDACKQPIEDAMVEWETPFYKVATLTYTTHQDIDSPVEFLKCEFAEFNPWFGVREHQPLGINRIRKAIYQFSSGKRHQLDNEPVHHF